MTDPDTLNVAAHLPGWVGPVALIVVMVVIPVAITWFTLERGPR